MSYLLDTNVVSEWVSRRPDANVTRWFAEVDEDRIYLSVITFAEIRRGIDEMPTGHRREALITWLQNDLPVRFEGRILGVDRAIAEVWGIVMATSRRLGANLSTMDAFLAATSEVHGLSLVTRNTRHFEKLGIPLLNPWGKEH